MAGLKICTRCRANSARRNRRINSSLLPENIGPTTTSIQPIFPLTMSTLDPPRSYLAAELMFALVRRYIFCIIERREAAVRKCLGRTWRALALSQPAARDAFRLCVFVVSGFIEHKIHRGHQMFFDAAKFGLEDGKVSPGMIRLISGLDPPKIVPLVSEPFCFAHSFKLQEVRRHYFPVNVARTAVKICGSRTKTDYERRRKQHAAIFGKKKRALSKRRK